MSQHDENLMDHDYDGIREYDNPMPGWWSLLFVLTIVFSIGYTTYFGIIAPEAGRMADYTSDMQVQAELNAKLEAAKMTPEKLQALVGDASLQVKGRAKFAQVCVPCHGAKANGMATDTTPALGPNLTDDHWLHGGDLIQIYKTVNEGVLAKGMPAWGKAMAPDEVNAVVMYVASLRNSNVPGKAPQGEPWTPAAK